MADDQVAPPSSEEDDPSSGETPESSGEDGLLPLPREVKAIIDEVPEPQRERLELAIQRVVIESQYSGPYPPPDMLAAYNKAFPNAAERIFQLTHDQAQHRMRMEEKLVISRTTFKQRGQVFGLVIGIAGLGVAAVLGYHGKEVLAGVIGTVDLIGLVAVFVLGRRSGDRPEEEEPEEVDPSESPA